MRRIDYKSAQAQIEEEKKQSSTQCVERTEDAACDAPAVGDGSSIQQSKKRKANQPT